MRKNVVFILLLLLLCTLGFSQSRFNLSGKDVVKIKFQLINNLIIIPVEVNGVKLSFILDSGVSKPILFNIINLTDSLQINNTERIYLRGLGGEGDIEALKSKHNFFKIGEAINLNQDLYVVFDNSINFTPTLGVNIHGIIGYDLFKDFIIEINYTSKVLKLNNPETYTYKKCRKCKTFSLKLYNNKPFIDASVTINSQNIPVKLLVDTGSSDALWLFEDDSLHIKPPQNKYFDDFLGKGLSGNIHGKRSKIALFEMKNYQLRDVNVAFPDSTSISFARKYEERNGSISGELLKRFYIIMDFRNSKMTVKKNGNFKKPFFYNKSGIILEQNGVRVIKEKENSIYYGNENNSDGKVVLNTIYKYSLKPAYRIVEIRNGSPAQSAGLLIGDVILTINNKGVHSMTLQELSQQFCEEDGKLIKLVVDRAGNQKRFEFKLENLLK